MPVVTVQVDVTTAGVTTSEAIDLELDFTRLTMRESVLIEQILGGEVFDSLLAGSPAIRPRIIQAMLYAKLRTIRPDIGLEDFDVDLEALYAALEESATESPKALPAE